MITEMALISALHALQPPESTMHTTGYESLSGYVSGDITEKIYGWNGFVNELLNGDKVEIQLENTGVSTCREQPDTTPTVMIINANDTENDITNNSNNTRSSYEYHIVNDGDIISIPRNIKHVTFIPRIYADGTVSNVLMSTTVYRPWCYDHRIARAQYSPRFEPNDDILDKIDNAYKNAMSKKEYERIVSSKMKRARKLAKITKSKERMKWQNDNTVHYCSMSDRYDISNAKRLYWKNGSDPAYSYNDEPIIIDDIEYRSLSEQ